LEEEKERAYFSSRQKNRPTVLIAPENISKRGPISNTGKVGPLLRKKRAPFSKRGPISIKWAHFFVEKGPLSPKEDPFL
jgi:hypothetical protein